MNIARNRLPSALKSSINRKPAVKQTINLSVLEVLLQKCQKSRQFDQILDQMIISGYVQDTFAASRLLHFSASAHFIDLIYSRQVLDQIRHPNCFIWNTMMRAYARRNSLRDAILLYSLMLQNDIYPDNYTHPILVQACAHWFSEREGKQVHTHVLRMGFDTDVYTLNTLINMYSSCGNLKDARLLFDKSSVLDIVTWNIILAGYVQVGDLEKATMIFTQMPERNTIASNSMIALFGWSNRVKDARKVFDGIPQKDIVSWTAIISCYEQNEMYKEALEMFFQMNFEEILVDEVVMISVLSACAHLGAIMEGELIHGVAVKVGLESYVNLQNALIHVYSSCGNVTLARKLFDSSHQLDQYSWNSMISGYLKCGLVDDAKVLFDALTEKDVVSWSTMIAGYAQHDRFLEALGLFHEMQLRSIRPNEITLVSVISSCAHLSALEQGKWVHAYIRKYCFEVNVILGTTLIDMYLKCGCVEDALEVFNGMEERGTSTWNAVIVGLAMNGLVAESLEKFSEMKAAGVAPNEITFVGVLGACRHVGLVNRGREFFSSMVEEHQIVPNVKHYGCMVDLLGRAGLLKEAEELIESMPVAPDVATWGALLGACRKHGASDIGERVGKIIIALEPQNDGFHVLLSNMFASRGRWDDVTEIRGMMKERGLVKTPGCSLIEANGIVHEFLAGDETHPQIKEIVEALDEMTRRLKMDGYIPDTSEVTLNVDEEAKETSLCRHSEKLAIAFGLISTTPPYQSV